MPAGTLTLTNNSAVVKGAGTAFNTELKAGDFIVSVVGGDTYTLPVKTVDSATQVTLIKAYDGPTQAGAAWYAVPRDTMNAITAQLAAETAKAMRGMNYDKENWQQVFSGTGNITVKLPDGSTYTGPAWGWIANAISTKSSTVSLGNGNDGRPWWAAFTSRYDIGIALHGANAPSASPWDAPSPYSLVNYLPSLTDNTGTAIASNWGGAHDYFLNSRNSASSGYQGWKGWVALLHSKNTTVDSNGFIKKASPIVKLFGDGSCELNEQSAGVTTERVSEGVYRIFGTLGFNSDAAWSGSDGGISIPKDRNDLPLVWVDYEVESTGDLLIKTYHREHLSAPVFACNKKSGYEDGVPIDIPFGRWVDLRVEVPIEEMEK
ncbi:phage tail fiber protein [Serratia quinivorans]|uniref:phage tail fiber protein n=1 Tax=Serratia quinivorans TaxID=137545 RepID=UPI003982ADD5